MATENLTQEEIIAKLTAERDAYKLEATGGKDLDALKKAEDSFNKFDKKIAEITLKAIGIEPDTEQKRLIANALVLEKYTYLTSKNKSEEWL